jgi:anti-sigma regulatory factor (Ser/Thr protein kinase)
MFYGVLDPRTRTLLYASAGHTPLLIWRAASGAPDWQATRGIPLGLMRDGRLAGTLDDREVQLEPGDVMFQFTDGYNEAFSPRGEAFGFGRIADLVGGHAAHGPEAVIAALREALASWSDGHAPEDDQTVLVIARAVAHDAAAPATGGRLAAADPVAFHERAVQSGHVLTLAPTMEALEGLGPWLAALPAFDALPSEPRTRIETVLYELTANVVEHGGAHHEGLELAWLAGPGDPVADPATRVREGCFVLRDHGYPFHPGRRRPFDPAAHPAWTNGRGLGLEIVHRVVSELVFRPGTTAGNLTLLSFDPARAQDDKEERHG